MLAGGVPGWCRCPEWSVQGSSNPRQHDPRLQTFTRLRSLEAGSVLGKQGRRAAPRSGRLSDNLGTPRYAKPDYSSNPDINGFDFLSAGGEGVWRPDPRLTYHLNFSSRASPSYWLSATKQHLVGLQPTTTTTTTACGLQPTTGVQPNIPVAEWQARMP